MQDKLGDRMKLYENNYVQQRLLPIVPQITKVTDPVNFFFGKET